jgi:hypothetical protein
MNRETELQHLALADRHIEEARERIARLQTSIASAAARGEDAASARTTLSTLQNVFSTFVAERNAIARTIADIEAGKYPHI